MIDPWWVVPYTYAVPVYYFPGGGHGHNPPPEIAAGRTPPLAGGTHTAVASAAPREMGSSHFGGFGGMRGFGGRMGGGRR
jgi:hypothetical protein